jgi:hypothetical protein
VRDREVDEDAWEERDCGFETTCHIHLGRVSRDGYGHVRRSAHDGETAAHRWVWAQAHGPIPKGMAVHHKCETPACRNLEHLALLTRSEQIRLHGLRVLCSRGHLITFDYVDSVGHAHRRCHTCKKASDIAWRALRRAQRRVEVVR